MIGGDWSFSFLDNRLFSNGQIIRSNVNNIIGNAFRFNLGYLNSEWWSARIWFGTSDDKFDINDLGFVRRNDITWAGTRIELRKQEPWGRFVNNNLEFKYTQDWNGSGLVLEREVEIEQSNLFSNYWQAGFLESYFSQDLTMRMFSEMIMLGFIKQNYGGTLVHLLALIVGKKS